jgi:hypothetical protein
VKKVKVSEPERFVVCHNPKVAERDATVRANLVGRFIAMNAGTDRPTATHRPELAG